MQPLLSKHSQRLTVELPASIPVVQADPRRTVQVVVNLLSNASKYGPINAEIIIGVSIAHGWVRVTVSDEGPGIAAERRADLFERFAASEGASSSRQAGFGLGLSVVKAIVEGHNGQVGVDDRPGGGCRILVHIACNRRITSIASVDPRMKALIVDDDRVLADVLAFTLRRRVRNRASPQRRSGPATLRRKGLTSCCWM